MNPKISVIIPVYNCEKYLKECIDGVRCQSLLDIEIICVDDGSTDNSINILKELAQEDDRIKVIQQANSGAGAARNRGLEIASGKYLSILDSDDRFEEQMLEKAYIAAENSGADLVVYRSDRLMQDTGRLQGSRWTVKAERFPDKQCFAPEEVSGNIFTAMIGWSWDKLFRKSFVDGNALKFQEIKLHNDLLFCYSAIALAGSIYFLDEILVHQRIYPESLSAKRIVWQDAFNALRALRAKLIESSVYETYERQFVNYAWHLARFTLSRTSLAQYVEVYTNIREEQIREFSIDNRAEDFFYLQEDYRALQILKATEIGNFTLHELIFAVPKNDETSKCELCEHNIQNSKPKRFSSKILDKLRGGIRCYQEHGLKYSLRRILVHFHIIKS